MDEDLFGSDLSGWKDFLFLKIGRLFLSAITIGWPHWLALFFSFSWFGLPPFSRAVSRCQFLCDGRSCCCRKSWDFLPFNSMNVKYGSGIYCLYIEAHYDTTTAKNGVKNQFLVPRLAHDFVASKFWS